MRFMIVAAAIAGALTATAAPAQVDARHAHQRDRIEHGVRSGALTPGEARRLRRQQGSIRRQEARTRYRNGGRLTPRERAHLRARENRASRHIYRAKHNGRHY